ncbi:MAG: creatininase family protein [Bryobacterales bacterium]|nr:creatininase family protein [Bryobacterales bacterium]
MEARISRRASLRSLAAAPLAALPSQAGIVRTDRGYIDLRKVRLWENTRKEFRESLEGGTLKAVIIPTASTEQHNEHLAMIHDTASVTLVAEQAALRLFPQVLVATPVSIGVSEHWMDRKGTLSLRKETFQNVVFDVAESLKRHGVQRVLILNGHGGNIAPLKEALPDFRAKLGIDVQFNSYWDAYTPEIIRKYMDSNTAPGHAAEFETSFALAAFPERVHWEKVDYERDKGRFGIKTRASAEQDEKFAKEARMASTAKGEAMIGIAVDWVANRLQQMISA